jgi:hypothetical protein
MLCLSYYCLSLLFNKTTDKDRRGSAWKLGGVRRRERGQGIGGEMSQTMHANVNK